MPKSDFDTMPDSAVAAVLPPGGADGSAQPAGTPLPQEAVGTNPAAVKTWPIQLSQEEEAFIAALGVEEQKAARAKANREAKAARKWAAVLEFNCSSGACQNVKGQPCTFADGRVRQKPHDQRILAAEKAGAYVAGQRVPAVARAEA